MQRRTPAGVVLAALWAWPPAAQAQAVDDATRQAARNLGMSGVEAYQAQDYATATEKLEKAYRALKVPSLGLWSARALVKVDKLIEAAERYQELQRLDSSSGGDRKVQEQARADAAKELDQLSPRIPSIVIELSGADAEHTNVTIDGVRLNAALIGEKRPVNPGKHRIEATTANATASDELQLSPGQTKTLTLRLGNTDGGGSGASAATSAEAAAPGTGSGRRTLGFVTVAVGGAGLVLGGVTGALALGKKGKIDDNPECQANKCAPSEAALVDSYQSLRTLSSVGFIAGAVVLTGGVVLLLSAPREPEQTALLVGPSWVGLSRSF